MCCLRRTGDVLVPEKWRERAAEFVCLGVETLNRQLLLLLLGVVVMELETIGALGNYSGHDGYGHRLLTRPRSGGAAEAALYKRREIGKNTGGGRGGGVGRFL